MIRPSLTLALCAILLAACVRPLPPATSPEAPVRVMSYNIRYGTANDGVDSWPNRADRVANLLRFYRPDVFGLQEALASQIDFLEEALPGYGWIGVGRDDGEAAGEFSPVFYNRERLEALESGTFWLSPTPDVPGSKGWDAAITRVATWARFRDRATGEAFLYLNTHFDHVGQQARVESAKIIADTLASMAKGLPRIVTGDFNVTPDNPAYATMTAALTDARLISETPPHGPEETFYGFVVKPDVPGRRIDYVFVSEGIRVLRSATLSEQFEGHYPSDHLPVLADVRW